MEVTDVQKIDSRDESPHQKEEPNLNSIENSVLVSMIIPAFNEERSLGPLIDRIQTVLEHLTKSFEIIVIDDGSKDHTLNVCLQKGVKIIHNHKNFGKGYALRNGFRLAKGSILVTIDGDGEHLPEEIPSLLAPLLQKKAEIVLGSRFLRNKQGWVTTAVNTFGNKLFNFIIRCMTNKKFTDTQCGFRAFNRTCLDKLDLNSRGYEIETEILIQIAQKNIPYYEVPINSPITYYRNSHLNRILDGLSILWTIFKTRLRMRKIDK
ncbi:MAG: glycosyltransferase family 2 protein [Candidatus Helarchaeota archaeon]